VSAGRIIGIVFGTIGILLGLALLAGGGFLLWADRTQREDGYLTTPTERFETTTYALTRSRLEVDDSDWPDWLWNTSWFGKVRIRADSADGKPVFVGIGPEVDVDQYLANVAHANVEDFDIDPFRVHYRPVPGGAPEEPPVAQDFWVASAAGQGQQTLTWKVRDGDWSAVLMNADGSRQVAANVDLGAKLSWLLWVAIGVLVAGGLLLAGSTALTVLAALTPPPPVTPAAALASPEAGPQPPPGEPPGPAPPST
jgi:hypothetical protein